MLNAKGLVNWQINPNQYTKLLQIAVDYQLLEIVDDFTAPLRNKSGEKVIKGVARMIGPGAALQKEYEDFKPVKAEFNRIMELIKPIAA